MASLTIRKLDEAIKAELRLRAARNGRAVEDEVRVILREASQNRHRLAATALAPERCQPHRFNAESEFEAGHIRIARDYDLIEVAPATADLMAKMAQGHADDLASAILLAADRPILLAPAMNPLMWNNPATRRSAAQLARDGVTMTGPHAGEIAEAGEAGGGRMAEALG